MNSHLSFIIKMTEVNQEVQNKGIFLQRMLKSILNIGNLIMGSEQRELLFIYH